MNSAVSGPWEIGHESDGVPIVTFEARDICRVENFFGDEEEIARLICAAPSMYRALLLFEALSEVRDALDKTVPGSQEERRTENKLDEIGSEACSLMDRVLAQVEGDADEVARFHRRERIKAQGDGHERP